MPAMRFRIRRRTWWLAAALAAACSSGQQMRPFPQTSYAGDEPAVLTAHWHDDFAFVDARIGDRPPRRFLLDTGASVVLLDPRTTDALGLSRVAAAADLGGAGDSSTRVTSVVPIDELHCGPLRLSHFDAMELDLSGLRRVLGHPLDGILPATAFRNVVLVVDYPQRRIEVRPAVATAPAPGSLPLREGALPLVPLRLGEREVDVLLDSGSAGFVTLPDALGWPRRGGAAVTGRQRTIAGDQPVWSVRFDGDIDWAGHRLAQPVVEVGTSPRAAVGAELLRHFRVELDQTNRAVRFERSTTEPIASPAFRSIGAGLLHDASHWTVGYVLPDSPAAQVGLREGDRIAAIDGVRIGAMTRGEFRRLLSASESVRLTLLRGDATEEIRVSVAVLVP